MVQRLSCEDVRLSTLTDSSLMSRTLYARGLMFPVEGAGHMAFFTMNHQNGFTKETVERNLMSPPVTVATPSNARSMASGPYWFESSKRVALIPSRLIA